MSRETRLSPLSTTLSHNARTSFGLPLNSLFWERAHGGLTHFPIALIFAAAFFDTLALLPRRCFKPRQFNAIAYRLMILAGVGAIGAVVSGLGASKWKMGGTGIIFRHHLFVWPAFFLVVGLVVWRVAARNRLSRCASVWYLAITFAACACIGAAGFFGGEMLLGQMISTDSTISTFEAAQGRHLFLMNCAHCHADDAHGDEGPDLYNLHKSDARIRQVITNGIKGEMPSFAKKLGDSDIAQLTAYLRTLKS